MLENSGTKATIKHLAELCFNTPPPPSAGVKEMINQKMKHPEKLLTFNLNYIFPRNLIRQLC